jgi:cytoskeletal protein CcmA (bactofilin family)
MPEPTPSTSVTNHLSSDVEIKGAITFVRDMLIDGKVEGEITSTGTLTLGENAEVRGEIKTKSVIVRGRVRGNITVEDRCELRGKAEVVGDLKASRLVMEEDATLVGKSEVGPNRTAVKPPEIVRPVEFAKQAAGAR